MLLFITSFSHLSIGCISLRICKILFLSRVITASLFFIWPQSFMKISPDFQELIDWNLMEINTSLYFRTIQDSNKNGDFDKDDAVFYYFVDLMDDEWKLNQYKPFN